MAASVRLCRAGPEPPSVYKSAQIEYEHFFNNGNSKKMKENLNGANSKLQNEVLKSKVEVLGEVLKQRVQASVLHLSLSIIIDLFNELVEIVFFVEEIEKKNSSKVN